MKNKKALLILKEVAIILLVIVVVGGAGFFIFKDYVPYKMEVPPAEKYVNLTRENYKVVGSIQDAQDATETFSTSPSELEIYQTEIRYIPGTVNPFKGENGDNDLPSETVTTTRNNYEDYQQFDSVSDNTSGD